MTGTITTQELLRLIDDAGLELATKPGILTGPALQKLTSAINAKAQNDSEE